jgi:hypothetical protein
MRPRRCLLCRTEFIPNFDAESSLYCSADCLAQAQSWHECLHYLLYDTVLQRADFQALLDDYTLREWAREMVWQQGTQQFMVCEDYTLANAHYQGVTLLDDLPVWRVRALSAEWSAVFFDYDIIPDADAHERKWLALEAIVASQLQNAWLLTALAHSASTRARLTVAGNPYTPPAVLQELAALNLPAIRYTLAHNSGAPLALLQALAQDPQLEVRVQLATNPALPPSLMERLQQDSEPPVRQALVRHSALPAELCAILAQDPHASVRVAVANDPRTPPALLEHLAQDANQAVSYAALRHACIPAAALAQAAHAADWVTRRTITENPAAPAELLILLSTDAAPIVRLGVANHANTPHEVLAKLLKDKLESVRRAAQENLAKRQERP